MASTSYPRNRGSSICCVPCFACSGNAWTQGLRADIVASFSASSATHSSFALPAIRDGNPAGSPGRPQDRGTTPGRGSRGIDERIWCDQKPIVGNLLHIDEP